MGRVDAGSWPRQGRANKEQGLRWLAWRSEGAELPVGDDAELVADEALQLVERLPAHHHQPHQVGAVVLLVEAAHRLVHADAPRLRANDVLQSALYKDRSSWELQFQRQLPR